MSFGVVRTRRAMRRMDRVHRVRGVRLVASAISVAGSSTQGRTTTSGRRGEDLV